MGNELILALTKIGYLLCEDTITISEDGNSIKGLFLDIPPYQRLYKWTAKNANQHIDDIDESMKSSKEIYRVGTLILHKHEKDGKLVYDIVDGQQRTITFSLLLTKEHTNSLKRSFLLTEVKFIIVWVSGNFIFFDDFNF